MEAIVKAQGGIKNFKLKKNGAQDNREKMQPKRWEYVRHKNRSAKTGKKN